MNLRTKLRKRDYLPSSDASILTATSIFTVEDIGSSVDASICQ